MNKNILVYVFIFSVLGVKANIKDTLLNVLIEKQFMLIPVQDNGIDKKLEIFYPNQPKSVIWIKLANTQTDYYTAINFDKNKGQIVGIKFNDTGSNIGFLNQVIQSDSFQVDKTDKYCPEYHFTPEYGWMNDPNGLVFLNGEYHLFFQHNPYGNKWGNMHWGHAVSKDLFHWEYLKEALMPDSLGDVFSGSCVIDVNNTAGFGKNAMVALYAANGQSQQQCLAYSTDAGRTFTKFRGNPVLPNMGIVDFRDPKVFWDEVHGKWIMALATGQFITFYSSDNLKVWEKLSEFGKGIGSHDGVWECPDLFPLYFNGIKKWVLLVSINPGGPNGGSATQYFIGNFDGKKFTADNSKYPLWMDYGRDNYAGITWNNLNENRRIFIGWMSNWDYANDLPYRAFRNAMTIARELKLKKINHQLILISNPVHELMKLNKSEFKLADFEFSGEKTISQLMPVNDGSYELSFNLKPESEIFGFSLQNSLNEQITCQFDLKKRILSINRNNSGLTDFNSKFKQGMIAPLTSHKIYKIRVLIDKSSFEIFVNNGEIALSSLFFPTEQLNQLMFSSKNNKLKISKFKISDINQ